MPWTIDAISGAMTHTGTSRDVLIASTDDPTTALPATYDAAAECPTPADNIKLCVRLSGDGRSGIECGIEGANLIIRSATYGTLSAAIVTAAHGLAAGERFTLRVRGTGDAIEAAVVKSSGAEVVVTTTTTLFRLYRGWGVATNVNNAVVTSLSVAERTAVQETVADVLGFIAGGDLWGSYDGSSAQLIAARVSSQDGRVSMDVDQDGQVVIVGGGRGRRWNPAARSVVDYVPSAGTLPGQTAAGVTTATIAKQFRARMALAGMEDNPTGLAFGRLGYALDYDEAALVEGRAVTLGVGANVTGTDIIIALAVMSNNALLVGCVNSMYVLLGDPGDLASDFPPASINTGCSGPNALTVGEDGFALYHGPEGFFAIPLGGRPINISANVLSQGISFPRSARSTYTVTVLRDPARRGVHIFIDDGSVATSIHYWYDEEVGRYDPDGGGFFPESYPIRPTCGTIWRGRPVIGTREGRIVEFSDAAKSDLSATAIDQYFHLSLVDGPGVDQEAVLHRLSLRLADDSDPVTVETFGGPTAQAVYDPAQRRALHPAEILQKRGEPLAYRVTAPALCVRLRNATAGQRIVLEEVDADLGVAPRTSPVGWGTLAAVGTACPPEVPSTPPAPTPTNPSGIGTANPPAGATGFTSTFRVHVTPGTNPTSTGLGVVLNLSSVGGSASQTMYDDGSTGGDSVAGDLIFTWRGTVTAAVGSYSLPFVVSDAQARSGNGTIIVTVTGVAPPPPGGGVYGPYGVGNPESSGVITVVPK